MRWQFSHWRNFSLFVKVLLLAGFWLTLGHIWCFKLCKGKILANLRLPQALLPLLRELSHFRNFTNQILQVFLTSQILAKELIHLMKNFSSENFLIWVTTFDPTFDLTTSGSLAFIKRIFSNEKFLQPNSQSVFALTNSLQRAHSSYEKFLIGEFSHWSDYFDPTLDLATSGSLAFVKRIFSYEKFLQPNSPSDFDMLDMRVVQPKCNTENFLIGEIWRNFSFMAIFST